MSFSVSNNIFLKILLYFITFGLIIGSGSLYRYAYSYNLIMLFTILLMVGVIFFQFFIPVQESNLGLNRFKINSSGFILISFFIFFPIMSDVINQVKSFEITYFHIAMLFFIFLLGAQSRDKILKYYLNLMVIFSFISLIYFFLEFFSEIPSFLPYYGIVEKKLSHFYYVWSMPVKQALIIRNRSIFWEPGAFGFHLIISTLLAYKVRNKLFITILIIACITTMSTTVYIFLCLLLVYQIVWGQNKIQFIGIILFCSIVVFMTIQIIFGNLDIPIYLMNIITEKFNSSSSMYASFEERTLFTFEAIKLFFDNIIIGAGHYASAGDLNIEASQTSGLAGLMADLGIFGIICIGIYIIFFKHFKLLAIPIALLWLNGEFMQYTPISLFILTHVVVEVGQNLFPSTAINSRIKPI